jgi:penicillin-binding protein 1A
MSTSNFLKKPTRKKSSDVLLKQQAWFPKVVKVIWIVFLCFVLGLPLYLLSVSANLFGLFGEMPSTREVENPQNDLSSELISADGVSLGRYFRFNRSQVIYDQLSPDLVNTFRFSEDHRFYDHSGMDFWAYPAIIWNVITFNQIRGGSTITQQLAKNLYTRNPDRSLDGSIAKLGRTPRRIVQKTKEWIISVDLEKNFTKEEIIAMYLNTAEFSSNSYGIKVAAETYFSKSPDSLNLQESALLVGMLQNPTFYNPVRNPENAVRKRNEVLRKVYRHGYKIKTAAQFDSVARLPLGLQFKIHNQNDGLATYFRTVLRNDLMTWCKANGYDLWESGLKIYTTIDSRMQRFAEESMREHMAKLQKEFDYQWKLRNRNPWTDENGTEVKNFLQKKIKKTDTYKSLVERYGDDSDSVDILLKLKKPMTIFSWKGERDTVMSTFDSLSYYNRFLQTGMMAMNPETGAIKAWVGGVNHKFFKFDHVRQAKRQPGSTFKAFVYGKAMEDGFSPCFELPDISPTIKISGGVYNPDNSDGTKGSGEKLTLRQALARSINSISVQLIDQVKPQNVVEFAHRLGIESPLDPVHALALGTSDVSLEEMVAAYSSFANLGIYVKPYYITRIEDKNGNVIENFVPKSRLVMDDETAYKMIYMLQGGVQDEQGTSRGLSYSLKVDNEIGGKTGTTDNASDGWYVGITHNLVSGVWVGGDERAIRFPSWTFGQGTKTARPIWDKFMVKVYAHPEVGYPKGYFRKPNKLNMTLDCEAYHASDSVLIDKPDEITLDDIQ